MASNDVVNRVRISTTLSHESIKQIDEISKITRINKSKLHDEAIEMLYHKYKKLSVIK